MHPITSNLKVAFFLNLSFTLIEFVGGILTNSVAILSDAVHDLSDTFAIGASWFLEDYSNRGRSRNYSFGYKRFSPLSALINATILLAGSVFIIFEAIPRLFAPEPVHVSGMMLLAVLGVIINGVAVLRLSSHQHSLNQRTIRLHLLEDVLGWVAVLIGAVVIYFTQWTIVDPILSLGVAVYILFNAVKSLRAVLRIFLQATPDDVNIEQMKQDMLAVAGVVDLHDTHVWTMDGQYNVLTVHLVIPENKTLLELRSIKSQVYEELKKHRIHHITIQFEVPGEVCALEHH